MEMPLHLQHQSWQPYLEHLCSLVYNHPPFELTRRMELVSPFQLFDLSWVTFKISHNCTTVFSNYCLSLWPQVCWFNSPGLGISSFSSIWTVLSMIWPGKFLMGSFTRPRGLPLLVMISLPPVFVQILWSLFSTCSFIVPCNYGCFWCVFSLWEGLGG